MKKNLLFLLSLFLFFQCSDETPERSQQTDLEALSVCSTQGSDIVDNNDRSDVFISFNKTSDESLQVEYSVSIVRSNQKL